MTDATMHSENVTYETKRSIQSTLFKQKKPNGDI